MRVVSGKYGGRPLKTLDGKTTRPTTDKVKGAIFDMIGPYFDGGRVLDLYAGSGPFDLVLLDPPYAKEQIIADIEKMAERKLLSEDIMVVCATDKSVDLPEEIADLGIWKQKIYGISKVTVYVR